jgi:3D-(3,5/4)-trihydroxycyclohexane-1,2-dione acylhydrolase (decyclizing)
MIHGYGSWWHVGVAEVSEKETIRKAHENSVKHINEARRY